MITTKDGDFVENIWYHPDIDMYEIQFKNADEIIAFTHAEMLDLKNKVKDAIENRNAMQGFHE